MPKPTLAFTFILLVAISTRHGNYLCYANSNRGETYNPYENETYEGNYYDKTYNPICDGASPPHELPIYKQDVELLQFVQNLEHWEADFFLWGALGYGLDKVAPWLVFGGPPPIGVRKANLDDPAAEEIVKMFGYQEIGHLRVLKTNFGGIPRPLLNLSAPNFAKFMDMAFEHKLEPPFDPYRDSVNYMLGSYIAPYVGLTGYVGLNSMLQGHFSKRITGGLLGVEAGQDAIIRNYLWERAAKQVKPYNYTVAEFTDRISQLRNKLGMCGIKDEGVIVPPELGAEGLISTNILSANVDSISYPRTPAEVLRIMYQTGDEHVPGGFYPRGGNGKIAEEFLESRWDNKGNKENEGN